MPRPLNPRIAALSLSDVEAPEFLKTGAKTRVSPLANPFDGRGMPKRWLALLAPLLNGEHTTKREMLLSARIDADQVSRGYLSDYFAEFVRTEICRFDNVNKVWVQGKNYLPYMAYAFVKAMHNEVIRGRWQRVLRLGLKESTAGDFMMDLEEEVQEENS